MNTEEVTFRLKPVVRFREFPFGTAKDPSMREFIETSPREDQDKVLAYLRSGLILAYPMGADLLDWFDRPSRANPLIDDQRLGGVTPMTDGVWFWHAGLIHFVERYNVRLPDEFMVHAAAQNWVVDREAIPHRLYDYSYC
jgi:hypothetical protein